MREKLQVIVVGSTFIILVALLFVALVVRPEIKVALPEKTKTTTSTTETTAKSTVKSSESLSSDTKSEIEASNIELPEAPRHSEYGSTEFDSEISYFSGLAIDDSESLDNYLMKHIQSLPEATLKALSEAKLEVSKTAQKYYQLDVKITDMGMLSGFAYYYNHDSTIRVSWDIQDTSNDKLYFFEEEKEYGFEYTCISKGVAHFATTVERTDDLDSMEALIEQALKESYQHLSTRLKYLVTTSEDWEGQHVEDMGEWFADAFGDAIIYTRNSLFSTDRKGEPGILSYLDSVRTKEIELKDLDNQKDVYCSFFQNVHPDAYMQVAKEVAEQYLEDEVEFELWIVANSTYDPVPQRLIDKNTGETLTVMLDSVELDKSSSKDEGRLKFQIKIPRELSDFVHQNYYCLYIMAPY